MTEEYTMDKKGGFALIEVLVTLFILTISILSINYVQLVNHKIAVNLNARNSAAAIGQRVLDSLDMVGLPAVVGTTFTVTELNRDFTVAYSTMVKDQDSSLQEKYTTSLQIDMTISWEISSAPHSIKLFGFVE